MFTYSDTIPDEFNLTIIHTNDVHAHFMQSNARGSPCVQARDLSQKRFNVQHDSGALKKSRNKESMLWWSSSSSNSYTTNSGRERKCSSP